MTLSVEAAEALLQSAKQAAEGAYAPYSHFPVGAALLCADGEIVTGVNVENISYGLTICAERTAIVRAIAQGKRRFQAIAVWATQRPYGAVTPCGACRQVMAEFLAAESPVIMTDAQSGQLKMLRMDALLPEGFAPGPGLAGSCPDTGSNKPGG